MFGCLIRIILIPVELVFWIIYYLFKNNRY